MAGNKSRVYKEFKARLAKLTRGGETYSAKDRVLDELERAVEQGLRRNHRAYNAYGKR